MALVALKLGKGPQHGEQSLVLLGRVLTEGHGTFECRPLFRTFAFSPRTASARQPFSNVILHSARPALGVSHGRALRHVVHPPTASNAEANLGAEPSCPAV